MIKIAIFKQSLLAKSCLNCNIYVRFNKENMLPNKNWSLLYDRLDSSLYTLHNIHPQGSTIVEPFPFEALNSQKQLPSNRCRSFCNRQLQIF